MNKDYIKSNEFLNSYEWRKLRQEVLLKYETRCMCCGAEPNGEVYLCVDHIKPRKTHPELALDISNLQILCNVCNHGKGNWHCKDWKPGETFIVTKQWLHKNKTPAGGYTRTQIEALGNKWPPKSGWPKRAIGIHITEDQRKMFEDGAFIKAKQKKQEIVNLTRIVFLEKELEILKLEEEIKRLKKKLLDG